MRKVLLALTIMGLASAASAAPLASYDDGHLQVDVYAWGEDKVVWTVLETIPGWPPFPRYSHFANIDPEEDVSIEVGTGNHIILIKGTYSFGSNDYCSIGSRTAWIGDAPRNSHKWSLLGKLAVHTFSSSPEQIWEIDTDGSKTEHNQSEITGYYWDCETLVVLPE